MMRTSLLVLLAGMALGAGCSDDREAPSSVRISPTVSRVTGLYFDKDDRIGLTISRTSGDYVTNRLMTYDGSVFTASGLKWYESTQETSTLTAYYPYSEAGVPSAFSVEADQRQGCTPSDLLGAVAREVRPGSAPVAMVFYHLMSQLSVVVENNGSSPVAAVKIGGSVVEAVVDLAVPSAKAKAGAAAVQIEAFEAEPDSRYRAVLVPQQTTLDVEVELQDGSVCRKSVSDALLEGGRCYDLSVVISGGGTPQIEVSISGDVVDWVDGGELVGSDGGNDGADGVDHEGEHYRTVAIDGKVWMAENMRHKPAGAQLGTGIWEPAGGASMISTQGIAVRLCHGHRRRIGRCRAYSGNLSRRLAYPRCRRAAGAGRKPEPSRGFFLLCGISDHTRYSGSLRCEDYGKTDGRRSGGRQRKVQ